MIDSAYAVGAVIGAVALAFVGLRVTNAVLPHQAPASVKLDEPPPASAPPDDRIYLPLAHADSESMEVAAAVIKVSDAQEQLIDNLRELVDLSVVAENTKQNNAMDDNYDVLLACDYANGGCLGSDNGVYDFNSPAVGRLQTPTY